MKSEEIISIALTFCMGFVAGAYFYITQAKPVEVKLSTPSVKNNSGEGYLIGGFMYGGCEPNCASFQVRLGGDFIYTYFDTDKSEKKTINSKLPASVAFSLDRAVSIRQVEPQSKSADKDACVKNDDGVAVRYEFKIESKYYELNSCGTTVDYSSNLWRSLNKVWEYLLTLK
jgi:hypothetical protein